MQNFLGGSSWSAFVGINVIILWFAWMTGRGLALRWRAWWRCVPYAVLLALASRFLGFSLFGGELMSVPSLFCTTAMTVVLSLFAYRVTKVHKLISQYDWFYERSGLLGWREKANGISTVETGKAAHLL